MSRYAYVTNTDSNDVSIVDLQTMEEIKKIPIGDSPRGAMAIDSKRSLGFISNCAGDTISVIDLLTENVTEIKVGLAPRGVEISKDNNYLFVSNSGSSTISIVDLENHEEVMQLKVGRNPRQLTISNDGTLLFVPNFGSDSISIIKINTKDIEKTKTIGTVTLAKGAMPYHAYPNEDGSFIFTANTFGHSVSVIDVKSMTIIRTIPVEYNPRAVITEPSGQYLLVSAEATDIVSVISRQTWQEIKRIPVGATSRGLVIDTKFNNILVTAFQRSSIFTQDPSFRDTMTVISLDTLTRIGNLPTGIGACSVNIVDTSKIFDGKQIEKNYSTSEVLV